MRPFFCAEKAAQAELGGALGAKRQKRDPIGRRQNGCDEGGKDALPNGIRFKVHFPVTRQMSVEGHRFLFTWQMSVKVLRFPVTWHIFVKYALPYKIF